LSSLGHERVDLVDDVFVLHAASVSGAAGRGVGRGVGPPAATASRALAGPLPPRPDRYLSRPVMAGWIDERPPSSSLGSPMRGPPRRAWARPRTWWSPTTRRS